MCSCVCFCFFLLFSFFCSVRLFVIAESCSGFSNLISVYFYYSTFLSCTNLLPPTPRNTQNLMYSTHASSTQPLPNPPPQDTIVDVLSVVPSVLFVAFDLRLWGFLRFLRLLRWADIATIVDSRRRVREKTSGSGDYNSGSSNEKTAGVQA